MTSRHLSFALLLSAALALSGCSMAPTSLSSTTTMAAIQGSVHGGQQGVVGATITAYATGTAGYGSASRQLATTTSGTNGSFSLSAASQCVAGDNIYIVATGGNPGGTGNASNSALAMMVGLGLCSGITNTTKVSINELTTVASVWALAPFMVDAAHIGTTPTNAVGLANAFSSITGKLVNTSTGVIPSATLPTTVTLPVNEINTLADILAACINTLNVGGSPSGTCQTILAGAPSNNVVPTNTLQAALNLATHSTQGLSLYGQIVPNSPYQPTLTAAPTSWTLAIQHSVSAGSALSAVAVDATGSVYSVGSLNNSGTIVALSTATGATNQSQPANFVSPSAVTVDSLGRIWTTDSASNDLVWFPSNLSAPTVDKQAALNAPSGIAFDPAGNAWITNKGNNSVTEVSSAGVVSNFTSGIAAPVAVAISPF